MADRQRRADVLAVVRDERTAADVAREAARITGSVGGIQVGIGQDQVASLRAEMREEVANTIVGPGNIGPFTKEMSKRMAWLVPVCAAVGAVVVLPLGLLPWPGPLWVRLVIAAVVGAFAGATLGFVLGGGLGPRPPEELLAAERGVTVRIRVGSERDAERVVAAVARHDPIRIDLVTSRGEPEGALTTEEELDRGREPGPPGGGLEVSG